MAVKCIIDAVKQRKVTTTDDIQGAFLQTLWPKENNCNVKFAGIMVDFICKIDTKYKTAW